MSIASDTQRIKSAKAAIQAAIEGKGVTVPDGILLDGMAALIEAIEAGGSIGEETLWNGGKYTLGSFILSEETTSEYIIATASDEGMRGLLNDGEALSESDVHGSINLLVIRRPTTTFKGSSYPSFLLASLMLVTHFGDGGGVCRASIYSDTYGTSRCSNSNSIGANVMYNKIYMAFTNSYKGSPDFEYLWLAWRGVK